MHNIKADGAQVHRQLNLLEYPVWNRSTSRCLSDWNQVIHHLVCIWSWCCQNFQTVQNFQTFVCGHKCYVIALVLMNNPCWLVKEPVVKILWGLCTKSSHMPFKTRLWLLPIIIVASINCAIVGGVFFAIKWVWHYFTKQLTCYVDSEKMTWNIV